MPHLELLTAPFGTRFLLRAGGNGIGRATGLPIQVDHPSMSDRHAEIRIEGGRVEVRDLDSLPGTLVNGMLVLGPTQLRDGDTVQCGDVVFVLRAGIGASPAPDTVLDPNAHPARSVELRYEGRREAGSAERLAVLLRVTELLAQPLDVATLREQVLDMVRAILPIDRALLIAADRDGTLEVLASQGTTGVSEHGYSQSIARYVLDEQVAALFSDAQSDARLVDPRSVLLESIRCAMCAPLVAQGTTSGVLYVDNRASAHAFTAGDLELLTGFANQAAAALHNASLQRKLRGAALRQQRLERFFPPTTVARLMGSGEHLGITELDVTVLFSDITDFTVLSETMAPKEVVGLLRQYFPPMARIVFEREGTLEKYIGDALLAVWGAPFAHDDDADRAVDAAVAMQRAVQELNARLPTPLSIHIGLHTGRVALANIGSDEYLQVATIGDATNTAARVCSAASEHEILISADTAARLTPSRWSLEAAEAEKFKGKSTFTELFKVHWRPD